MGDLNPYEMLEGIEHDCDSTEQRAPNTCNVAKSDGRMISCSF
jgi:hypothetical protein